MDTYSLSDDEIIILDGKVNQEVQKKIDFIKSSRIIHSMPIVGKTIANSIKTGTFEYSKKSIHICPICNKSAGYATFPRDSRNRYGHKKGETDYSRPLSMPGYALNEGFISIQGVGDLCSTCNETHKIIETIINEIIDKNYPIEIVGDKRTKYKKDKQRKCYKCNNLMNESEMGKSPTVMGDGYYPSSCPSCGASSSLFGKSHVILDSFRMLPIAKQLAKS